jgi:hypothetical protein
LRVLKFFKVGEHGKVDLVVESFNLLNHTNVVALNRLYGMQSSPISVFATPNKASIPRELQFSIDFESRREQYAQQSSAQMTRIGTSHRGNWLT